MHLVLQEPEIEGVSILYSVERLVAHVRTKHQEAIIADTRSRIPLVDAFPSVSKITCFLRACVTVMSW